MLDKTLFEQVPEAQKWIGIFGEVDERAMGVHALRAFHYGVVLACLWPDLVEVDGAILRREFAESSEFAKWRNELSTVRELESMGNHLHLWDVMDAQGVPAPFVEQIASVVGEMWLARAQTQFPGRDFHVEVTSAEADNGPTVYLEQDDHGVGVPLR